VLAILLLLGSRFLKTKTHKYRIYAQIKRNYLEGDKTNDDSKGKVDASYKKPNNTPNCEKG
jgi:hypothetical protein